jgi:hypothetical protein
VGVTIRVSQLIGDGIDEEVSAFAVQINYQALEDVAVGTVGSVGQIIMGWCQALIKENDYLKKCKI